MSSLSHENVMAVMAYADGELDGASKERVEALLRESAEAKSLLASLRGIGSWIETQGDAHAKASGADSIANAVMSEVSRIGAPIDFASARSKKALRLGTIGAVATTLALAAAVFLLVKNPESASNGHSGMAALGTSATGSAPSQERATYDVVAILATKGPVADVDPMLGGLDMTRGELAEYNRFRVIDRKSDVDIRKNVPLVVSGTEKLEVAVLPASSSDPAGRHLGVTLTAGGSAPVLSFRLDAPKDPKASFLGTGHKFQDGLLVIALVPR